MQSTLKENEVLKIKNESLNIQLNRLKIDLKNAPKFSATKYQVKIDKQQKSITKHKKNFELYKNKYATKANDSNHFKNEVNNLILKLEKKIKMQEQINKVAEFQKSFGQFISQEPMLVSFALSKLRFELMKEENEEYLEAVAADDLVEIADALGDQLYILCGTILTHGMQHIITDVFDEIHRSNMSKLDMDGNPIINGQNGVLDTTREIGKVLKSTNYSEPNLKQFL
jgi:predicted HAD superfamily Cof-like phosphohydrolase